MNYLFLFGNSRFGAKAMIRAFVRIEDASKRKINTYGFLQNYYIVTFST